MLDPTQLAVGDQLYDTRRKVDATVVKVAPCGSCACGHGDISVREDRPDGPYRRTWSFAQFRRLKSIVKQPPSGGLRYDDDLGWLIDNWAVRSGDQVLIRARNAGAAFAVARLVCDAGTWVSGTAPWDAEIVAGGLVFRTPARGRHVELARPPALPF